MATIFGYVLMVASIYAFWDTFKVWRNRFRQEWKKSFATVQEETDKKTGFSRFWGCLSAPFVLFREFIYTTIFIPGLAVYGLMQDNKMYALVVLAACIILFIYRIYVIRRAISLTIEHDKEKKAKAAGEPMPLLLAQNGKPIGSIGDLTVATLGWVEVLAMAMISTLCNAYVVYLFWVVVIK